MTPPLRISFDVDCSAEHAFTVRTSGIATWWPADHTVTGRTDLDVVMQSGVGGRIYERTPDGAEHDWGEVTVWSPPTRPGDWGRWPVDPNLWWWMAHRPHGQPARETAKGA